jgi:hypothetical protein
MCRIYTTQVTTPYPGVRQILSRGDVCASEDEPSRGNRRHDFARRIPEETRFSLMAFLMARDWSVACDILVEHPSLVAPWASQFLRDLALWGQLSARDFEVFCTHVFVLDLAQTLGIERTRAFLKRLGW